MQYLILTMIFAGSALMVYNIVRYGMFLKRNADLERNGKLTSIHAIPLVLLIFFLVAYVIVGFSGIADVLIASILLGGSIFVFMLLWVMFKIIDHIKDTEQVLAARYEEIKDNIVALTKDSTAVMRVNLTKDEIEELSGDYLYDSDHESVRYSDLIEARGKYLLDPDFYETRFPLFTRDGLLKQYQEGHTSVAETALVLRSDGTPTYVKFAVTLTKMPVSGDVVAFIVESPYNMEVVRTILLEKVLMDEYNRIAYIINGNYKVLVSNAGKKAGMILQNDEDDTYESIYYNYFLPAMSYDPAEHGNRPNPLRLSVIEKELEDKDSYVVDAPFTVNGEALYKHIVFYKIDERAKFYLMLISDSTKLREEQEQRNRELSDALAKAVKSNESRVRFFTNISHELRTPLNGVLGFTDLAINESDPATVRSYLSKVRLSGQRLLSIINDLFTISLIDIGTLTLEETETDLSRLAGEIASFASEIGAEKELSVEVRTADVDGETVICDAQRITQIFDRLLVNSASFAPAKSRVLLTVSSGENADKTLRTYRFTVENKGVKIPKEVIPKIFKQSAWYEFSDIPGAGIGMAAAKKLLDIMGAEVDVRSEDDTVVFDIRIPLRRVSGPDDADTARGPAEAAEQRPLRLLVVDDNEINREIANLILTGEGHTVELAVNGAEAVEKVRESAGGRYDAVLMDVQMPVMNGFEATANIRALPDKELAAVPIIAMTANAYQEDQNEALAAGMNGYVSKPIDPGRLREVLMNILS